MAVIGWLGCGGAAVTLGLPLLLTGLAGATNAAATDTNPVTLGPGVPQAYRADVLAAADTCPRISPSVLAAQLAAESSWNPRATSPAGAQGIAQFMPDTWDQWGGDHDEDGTSSPYDPGDAIRAQGRFMCHLLDTVIGAGLGHADPVSTISLALAAHNAGPAAVLTHRGIPPYPQTRDYVARVWTLATSPDHALHLGADTDTPPADLPPGGVDAMLPPGYRNGRTAGQAVAYALTQVGVWRDAGYCLRFIGRAVYHRPGGTIPSAHMVWDNAPASQRHPRDFNPPRGAIALWSSRIGRGHGHIAISLGGGKMVTTTRGAVAIANITGFADPAYLGWMPPYFRSSR
ncbi:MAG: lytic transglycosylase domain-containing protein [Candidatus Nanopelagicales bacterium]